MRPPPPPAGPWRPILALALLGLVLAAAPCAPAGEEEQVAEAAGGRGGVQGPDDPPTARRETLLELRRSHEAARHPADGGGRAWIESSELQGGAARAGGLGRWTILYEAGPEGVAVGGSVRLVVSPFWEWSPAQVSTPGRLGYTRVESLAEGVELETRDRSWLQVTVRGRALREGERIRIVYGAGPEGARIDGYAERGEHFWIAVDGDGDDVHRVLADSPTIDVLPGRAGQLSLVLPSTARPGDEVPLRVALLDRRGNAGCEFVGTVELASADPEAVELPESVRLGPEDGGRRTVTVRVLRPAVVRLAARAVPDPPPGERGAAEGSSGEPPAGAGAAAEDPEPGAVDGAPSGAGALLGESNPLVVQEAAPRILWGDLHGHSNLSDGTGTPEDFLLYARDVAGLDVVALTDHDHWGMLFLDENPAMWERIRRATQELHEPGRFVTVLGYEWTSWIHGHRHVLYLGDDGPILSSIDPAYETPAQLWDGLRREGLRALTFAHHSAGGPIATNWDFVPDPEFEPVTEVASVHGSSEAPDSPHPIYSPLAGNFVRDVLDRGLRLGFIGSGDSHDGHPGLAQIASGRAGMAAILSEELTREGVFQAMHARRVYATNGPRIVLRCALGAHRMGEAIPAAELAGTQLLFVHAIGCAALERIDVVRSGEVVQTIDAEGAWDYTTAVELADLRAGEYVYVRVVQADRGAAWSSPFYVE